MIRTVKPKDTKLFKETNIAYVGNPRATTGNIANIPIVGKRKIMLKLVSSGGMPTFFRTWWRYREFGYKDPNNSTWSYSSGDGGKYRVTIEPVSGITAPICEGEFVPNIKEFPNDGPHGANNQFRKVTFHKRDRLTKGNEYYIVFENIHDDPRFNYVSLNGVFDRDKDDPFRGQPLHALTNRVDEIGGNGVFKENHGVFNYYPQWGLDYQDGSQDGQPYQYGSAWTAQHNIGGFNRVRQFIKVDAPTAVEDLHFYVTRLHGRTPLYVDLDGLNLKAQFGALTMPAMQTSLNGGKDYNSFAWKKYTFLTKVLRPGRTYKFEFYTKDESQYYIPCSVKAGAYTGIKRHFDSWCEWSSNGGRTWQGMVVNKQVSPEGCDLNMFLTGRMDK